MRTTFGRVLAGLLALTLVAAACGDDDDDDGGGGERGRRGPVDEEDIDYEAIGLWDDGPCDEAMRAAARSG